MADEWQPVTRFIAGAALIRLVCTVKSGMLSSASPSLCHLLPSTHCHGFVPGLISCLAASCQTENRVTPGQLQARHSRHSCALEMFSGMPTSPRGSKQGLDASCYTTFGREAMSQATTCF